MDKERLKPKKLNNEGSTIITVLVIVTFITILATAILYIAVNNFFMKKTEQRDYENFYASETALEEIKAGLAKVLSEACTESYEIVLQSYATYPNATTRNSVYLNSSADYIKDKWNTMVSTATGATLEEKYANVVANWYNPSLPTDSYSVVVTCSGGLDSSHANEGYFILKGVAAEYRSADYYSRIETDYIIKIPDMKFELDNSTSVATEAIERGKIDYTRAIQYMNWVKK